MVFSSLFFLYFFLPLNLIFYYFARTIKAKNAVMLIFSLVFYAWGEPTYLLLLIFMALCDWLLSLYIGRQKSRSGRAKFGLVMMAVINLGLLCVFKYLKFIMTNVGIVLGADLPIPDIILPIGISFYTFQLISYVVDVYRGEVAAQKNFGTLLLYVSLFHQCIAGPIVRYKDVASELADRRATHHDIAEGIWRFCFGLAKKAILANAMSSIAEGMLAGSPLNEASVLSLWVSMIAYTLHIYFDFSAYSDMAIGMGRMLGIHYLENFNYPYISRSVTEFWRRWHISLGSFFRDYVYIPLGGNRKGKLRTYLNLFAVWCLTGLWHGASWNFVLWGLYFFVFIFIEKLFLSKVLSKIKILPNLYLLIIVVFGWVLFRFSNMSDVICIAKGMFGLNGNALTSFETTTLLKSNMFILIFAAIVATPIVRKIGDGMRYTYMNNRLVFAIYSIGRIVLPIIMLLLSTATLVGDSYNPFIYFQF